jgi:hypothetical protein
MPSLTTIVLVCWGVTAAGLYGWHHVDKRGAVKETWALAKVQCERAVEKMGKDINDAAEKRIADAMDAAGKVDPVPADDAALERLCHADPLCRQRPD